ncbi:guanylate kinase [Patulibacter sp. S7RM1-6]
MARVFVITGPSGVGKGTLIRRLRETIPELRISVSATTRPPRAGEEHGRDYWFLDDGEFDRRVREGDFVEHAEYAGRKYGTLREELERHLGEGAPVVLEIEVQGARQVRETMPEAVQVFVVPPSFDALRARLEARGTDGADTIARRLEVSRTELESQHEFDHRLVNDDLDATARELEALVREHLSPSAGAV